MGKGPGGESINSESTSACQKLRCKNGGSCEIDASGDARCICQDGLSGRHCEKGKLVCTLYNTEKKISISLIMDTESFFPCHFFTPSLSWWSCLVTRFVFHKLRLSMEHHRQGNIRAPPHCEAGFCFRLEFRLGAHTYNESSWWPSLEPWHSCIQSWTIPCFQSSARDIEVSPYSSSTNTDMEVSTCRHADRVLLVTSCNVKQILSHLLGFCAWAELVESGDTGSGQNRNCNQFPRSDAVSDRSCLLPIRYL